MVKLTQEYLRKLIIESLIEGDVIRGSFGGQPAADLGKPATVSPIRKAGPAMPEGTEWLTDASALIDAVMNNIDDIAKVDEALANKLFDLAEKLSPIFKSGSESLADLPAGAFEDDPDRRENASTERTYEDPEDLGEAKLMPGTLDKETVLGMAINACMKNAPKSSMAVGDGKALYKVVKTLLSTEQLNDRDLEKIAKQYGVQPKIIENLLMACARFRLDYMVSA